MRRTSYDKQAVIDDLAERKLTPQEIADKHDITIGNVYNIKAVAKREGLLNSRGFHSLTERARAESAVLTPELRERIKDLREDPAGYTSTEIANMLGLDREDVIKVSARSSGGGRYAPRCA